MRCQCERCVGGRPDRPLAVSVVVGCQSSFRVEISDMPAGTRLMSPRLDSEPVRVASRMWGSSVRTFAFCAGVVHAVSSSCLLLRCFEMVGLRWQARSRHQPGGGAPARPCSRNHLAVLAVLARQGGGPALHIMHISG